jgi:hypothetical protein
MSTDQTSRTRRGHRLFAAAYDRLTRPLEQAWLGERRARLLGDLTGDVLDVGAGTGANLRYLRRAVTAATRQGQPRAHIAIVMAIEIER